MSFKTPILMVVFNRQDTTQKVFDQVKKIQPEKLYIAADGPRVTRPEDNQKCAAVKEIFNQIDWPCEVKTLFQEKNLGCHTAVPDAITWFFNQEEEGIILEDDCLPDLSFFRFCQELLEKYRDDTKVMMISGDNFTKNSKINESYAFSKYAFIWGWASWRRAWNLFDNEMKDYPKLEKDGFFANVFKNIFERFFWKTSFTNKYTKKKEGWDTKWIYSVIINKGLSVIPKANLVQNLGFTSEATATFEGNAENHVIKPVPMVFPLIHPNVIKSYNKHDIEAFNRVFLSTVSIKQIIKNYFPARGKL